MGLAAYGKVTETKKMRKILSLKDKGLFELNLDYFIHHSEGVSMTWNSGEPKVGIAYSSKLTELLGPARRRDEPLTQYHMDIAASLQEVYEDALFHLLSHVYKETKSLALCLAGGCAMNSVANGKIFAKTRFRRLYIQSAACPGAPADGRCR